VRPRDIKIGSNARFMQIDVETSRDCSWTAVSNDPWIRVVWGASGTGNGEVTIGIGGNDGKTRKGTLTIAGETVEIEQKKDDDDDDDD
jgi:hypothetical protein